VAEELFADEEVASILHAELKSWLRTPYRHWAGVKGKGCDCIHLVIKSLEVVDAFNGAAIVIPKYTQDWHLHRGDPRMKDFIEKMLPSIMFTDKSVVKNGDVVLFQYGRQAAHCGIYFDNEVYQAINEMGVHTRQYTDKDFYERVKYIYRAIKI
jgi:cell wall-associated NlpC family hydrolase